ncbi:MAG: cytochrome C [Nitrosomonadales bacterium]|nr:cytochrome C [Nitrosomonadales bacterium]
MRIILGAISGLLLAGGAHAAEMPAMAQKQGCTVCHAIDKKVVGPAWMDVSRKYKGAAKYTYSGSEYPLEEGLVMKVSKGGFGNWGSMPMPPNDANGNKQADIRELVRFILNLAK